MDLTIAKGNDNQQQIQKVVHDRTKMIAFNNSKCVFSV